MPPAPSTNCRISRSASGTPARECAERSSGVFFAARFKRAACCLIALGAAVLLIVGAAGAAYWGLSGRHSRTTTKAIAVATVPGAPSGAPDTSYIFKRQLVYYRSIHPVGTMVISKSQRFLYLVRPEVVALRYTIGVGRECVNAVGLLLI